MNRATSPIIVDTRRIEHLEHEAARAMRELDTERNLRINETYKVRHLRAQLGKAQAALAVLGVLAAALAVGLALSLLALAGGDL